MAADSTAGRPDFGQVSRTAGRAFRALLLAGTLVGVLALAVLLVYVTVDAVQPLTADPGWHALFLGGFVLPSLLAGRWLLRREGRALWVGLIALGIPVIGLLFAAGVATLFIDVVPPTTWLGYALAAGVTVAGIVGLERTQRVPFLGKLAAAFALTAVAFWAIPAYLRTVPILPADWLIMLGTVGAPVAWLVGRYAAHRWDGGRPGRVAAGSTLGLLTAAAWIGILAGVGSVPTFLIGLGAVLPLGLYAAVVRRDDPTGRIGLVLPVVVIGSLLLVLVAADLVGLAGPQSWVDWSFLTSSHDNTAAEAGIYPALVGSIMLMVIVAAVAFPLGVGAAVYLEEYAPDSRTTRLITVNISNLAGVPSIVYGLLGLGLFIRYAGAPPGTVLVGGFTLALLILPIVIIAAQEAIRSVPDTTRKASYGMGATRWQTIREVVLPQAFPGILTGTILALGRAIGETAPLLVIGAANVADLPTELSSRVAAMPLQVFVWATTFAGPDFYEKAVPAAAIVLLVVLLAMNSIAVVLRNRFERSV